MNKNKLSPIKEILKDAKKGKMFILVDDKNRENEGDLIIPASKCNSKNINFMAKHGRGLICLALTKKQVENLSLPLMSSVNKARMQTAFTVSIEAKKGITTGISAFDRARTIKTAINLNVKKKDIVSPGHVFPLVAKNGGVLERAGHTEASIDISKLANTFSGMFGKASDAAKGVLSGDTSVKDAAVNALSMAGDTAVFLAGAGMSAIGPDIAKGIGAGTGTAINPYATLVFSGVDLKVHTFEWTLSPDTPEEAETLRKIVGTIQNNITPEVNSVIGSEVGLSEGGESTLSRGLLRYPSMVDCFFYGIDSNFFYKMKTCMISQFNVDYAPNGIALNRGGKPSAMRINMVMTEAAIHTKADYGEFIAPSESPGEETEADASATNEGNIDNLGVAQ